MSGLFSNWLTDC